MEYGAHDPVKRYNQRGRERVRAPLNSVPSLEDLGSRDHPKDDGEDERSIKLLHPFDLLLEVATPLTT